MFKKNRTVTDTPKKRHPILRKVAKYTAIGTIATAGVLAVNSKVKGRPYGTGDTVN